MHALNDATEVCFNQSPHDSYYISLKKNSCTYRIIVSAPNGTAPGSSLSNLGVVFTCPVEPGNCEGLLGDSGGTDRRLFDIDGESHQMSSSIPDWISYI